jgi:hypothetical protein
LPVGEEGDAERSDDGIDQFVDGGAAVGVSVERVAVIEGAQTESDVDAEHQLRDRDGPVAVAVAGEGLGMCWRSQKREK